MAAVMRFPQRQVLMTHHLRTKLVSSRRSTTRIHEELSARLAKSSDFDDVVKLSEGVYDEYDYIPVVFHEWLKMENMPIVLLHTGRKLVGLIVCCIVDDGRTFVRRAGRISPELRGQGLFRKLMMASNEYVRANFSKVCRERQVTFTELTGTKAVNPYRKLLEQDVPAFYVEEKPFRKENLPYAVNNHKLEIVSCTKQYFSNIILSHSAIENLFPAQGFPNNILLFDWCPFESLRSNIDLIMRENPDLHFFVEKCCIGAWPTSFSYGVYKQRVKTVEWQATVYTDDPAIFEAHLLHQFKRASEIIESKFTFFAFQDQSMAACAKRVLGEILQLKQVSFDNNEKMKLFERDFIQ